MKKPEDNPAFKHGHTTGKRFTLEYYSWASMKARCNNAHRDYYEYYGGRGVTVCERWNSFENFLHDMGPRPSKEYSLDRIDCNGNYEPSNCRWATRKEQRENIRPGKWEKAKERMLAFIKDGADTAEKVHAALTEEGVILHEETVRELLRKLKNEEKIKLIREQTGRYRSNKISCVL